MGGQHPVHPAAQFAIGSRPEHEVEMVGHQAVRDGPHRHPDAGLARNPEERIDVFGFVKDFGPCVAAVDDYDSGQRPPGRA